MNKTQLLARCKELGIDPSALDTNAKLREAIAAKEAELKAEADKAAEEKAAAEKEAADKAAADKAAAEKTEADKVAADKKAAEKAEADKAAADKAAAKKAAAEKAAAEKAAVYEDERGRKWKFKPTAPKKINIDGHSMSQADILQSEDVISELVHGNSSFLTQIV